MYKILISLCLWDQQTVERSSKWCEFDCQIELPFPPFLGLELILPSQRPRAIKNVCWSVEKECFFCRLQDAFTDTFNVDSFTFEEQIERLVSASWASDGPYPKNT